jgi:uncharacterized protein YpbB
LWVEKKSIDEIATIRVLTKQTIYSHFVKLMKPKAVAISEVLPADKMQDLAAAFGVPRRITQWVNGKTRSKFSWEEARMYKASLN